MEKKARKRTPPAELASRFVEHFGKPGIQKIVVETCKTVADEMLEDQTDITTDGKIVKEPWWGDRSKLSNPRSLRHRRLSADKRVFEGGLGRVLVVLWKEGALPLDDDYGPGFESMSTDHAVALPALMRIAGDPMSWCVWDEVDIGMTSGKTLDLDVSLALYSYKKGNNPQVVLGRLLRLAAVGLVNPVGGRIDGKTEKWEFTPGSIGDEFRARTFDVIMDAFNEQFQLKRKDRK